MWWYSLIGIILNKGKCIKWNSLFVSSWNNWINFYFLIQFWREHLRCLINESRLFICFGINFFIVIYFFVCFHWIFMLSIILLTRFLIYRLILWGLNHSGFNCFSLIEFCIFIFIYTYYISYMIVERLQWKLSI